MRADAEQQRVAQRPGAADRRGLPVAGQRKAEQLAQGDQGTEGQRDARLHQAGRGRLGHRGDQQHARRGDQQQLPGVHGLPGRLAGKVPLGGHRGPCLSGSRPRAAGRSGRHGPGPRSGPGSPAARRPARLGRQPSRCSAAMKASTSTGSNWRPDALAQLGDGLPHAPGPPVGPGGCHRVEGVGHRDHPGELGDLVAGQAHRVALAVHPLVMMHDAVERLVEEPDLPDDLQAAHRVQLDRGQLLLGQRPGLLQHLGRHAELAHVMQHAREPDGLHPLGAHADLPGQHGGAPGDPLAVPAGVEVLGLHRLAERGHGGGVRGLLRGELPHRPAGHEQRDQHEDRGERADQVPQRGDQQPQRGVAQVGREQQREVQVQPPALRVGPGRGQQQQHAPEQAVVDGHVHGGRHRERQDVPGEPVRVGHADPAAQRHVGDARGKRAQRVHRAVEDPLAQPATAQAEQRAGADQRGTARAEQHDGRERGRGTGRPGGLAGCERGRGGVTDQEEDGQDQQGP